MGSSPDSFLGCAHGGGYPQNRGLTREGKWRAKYAGFFRIYTPSPFAPLPPVQDFAKSTPTRACLRTESPGLTHRVLWRLAECTTRCCSIKQSSADKENLLGRLGGVGGDPQN